MVKKATKILVFFLILFYGKCMSSAQTLRNIKYFNKDILKIIDTIGYYQCIGIYFSDKNYKIITELRNETSRILKFKGNGYIESNTVKPNREGYNGILYSKNDKLKIDLIGGASDGSKIIRSYKLKIEGNRLHLLEDNPFMGSELIYYIYERKAN